jgi:HAD superfamily hydrolase (TIGR01509 family)
LIEIRHIVFDLGNVLFRWDPEIPYRRLIPDHADRRRFLTEVCTGAWLLNTDIGLSWREAEDQLILRYPHDREMIRAFRRHWHEMLPGGIEESIAAVDELIDGGADVTALTNWAADTFPVAETRFPILGRMRGVTVSGRVGMIKPDPAIYHHHARTFGLDPTHTLFFDDNPHNVEAARWIGWQAQQFTGPDQLRADLARYRIVVA